MKRKLDDLIAKYGPIALVVYLVIFAGTWVGLALAISMGIDVGGVVAGAGSWGAAYVVTKMTQPLRIGATLVLTPLIGSLLGRKGPAAPEPDAADAPSPGEPDDASSTGETAPGSSATKG